MFKISQFIREVLAELRKVTWPSRMEVVRHTVQVVVFSLVVAIIIGAADFGLLKLFNLILN